ncbi:hypothetical protein AQJ58_20635 [Streptomyces sp. DSM 15324]|nr:hypothetical protein AQJ58_20635 [Streptomyces sp. DSM 15324]
MGPSLTWCGSDRQVELLADLPAGEPLADQVQDAFSRGERPASSDGTAGLSAGSGRSERIGRAVVAGAGIDWPEATVRTAEERPEPLIR